MEVVTGAKKRKTSLPSATSKLRLDDKRPKVHAQRKFAQGQGQSPMSSANASPAKLRPSVHNSGNHSSGSSTASGPTSKKTGGNTPTLPFVKGENPKTEDFLTFLCLRGTSLLPAELDFFNRPSVIPDANNDKSGSDDEGNESSEDEKLSSAKMRRKKLQQQDGKANNSKSVKQLPASVRALKRKYTEQRLVRSVVTKVANQAKVKQQQQQKAASKKASGGKLKASMKAGRALRSHTTMRDGGQARKPSKVISKSPTSTKVKVQSTKRKPSAAAIIAKRKTRMATLTAASKSRVSRMLTRLTPRGTSSAAFVRKAKKMPMQGRRSLRGRDISVSSNEEEEEEEEEEDDDRRKQGGNRKMVCRKSASRRHDADSDSDEDSDDEDVEDDEESENSDDDDDDDDEEEHAGDRHRKRSGNVKKRPGRKSKESATVYLNMLGQKMSSKRKNAATGDDDDNISIDSLSESTQGRRLKEAARSKLNKSGKKVQQKVVDLKGRKVIKPSLVKKENRKTSVIEANNSSNNGGGSESSENNDKRRKDKKLSSTPSLKELQDRLLLEAKKKIASTPEAAPLVQQLKAEAEAKEKGETTSSGTSESERITISHKTGYIQVKPRLSTDQLSLPDESGSNSPQPQRRLSISGSERTSTPPRKILPKGTEMVPTTQPVVTQQQAQRSHLPVGVVGAALSSARPASGGNTPPRTIPLSQPLVINTSLNPAHSMAQVKPIMTSTQQPQQQQQPPMQAGIIMSRMPMPIQIRPGVTATPIQPGQPMQPLQPGQQVQGVPIIMPPIALPNGSILQPVTSVAPAMRPPFAAYGQPPIQPMAPGQQPYGNPAGGGVMMPMSSANTKCTTDVTNANTQPMVSPGPPILSPQQQKLQQQQQQQQNQYKQKKNTPVATTTAPPPVLAPAGLPVTSGAVIRSVMPSKMKTQMSRMPQASGFKPGAPTSASAPRMSAPHPQQMHQHTPKSSKQHQSRSIFNKDGGSGSSSSSSRKQNSSTSTPSASTSFKVDNEASPYAFEPEPLEVRPKLPYRNKPTASAASSKPSPKATSSGKTNKKSPKGTDSKASTSAKAMSATASTLMQNLTGNSGSKAGKGVSSIQCQMEEGSSIPLPAELASQLVAQAAAEGPAASNETTYFIPLKNNFGVAVKLGTEGPPGPDQKVIMKAKLVTQPSGKPAGARVIGPADPSSTSPGSSGTKKKSSPETAGGAKRKSPAASISAAATAAASAKAKAKMMKASRDTSSSSSDDSSSSDSDAELAPIKKKRKKLTKSRSSMNSPPSSLPSPTGGRKGMKDVVVPLPVTSPTMSSKSASVNNVLGTIEAMDRFPKLGQHAHLVEAPVFRPTEAEFKDPMKYIQAIRRVAEPFGICKIIPPASFKPECNVDDDMRFTSYNQYVHKLMNRWGPNSKEMAAIKKYLDTQNVNLTASNHPVVSGVEIDLPALYHAVQALGGLTEVIQKKKWGKIAEFLRVPKGTQDRSNKFYDIYCKFLLPYDTLSKVEREELLRLVDEEFDERLKEKLEKNSSDKEEDSSDDENEEEDEDEDEDDECVLKGKSTSLSQFFRVARNLMSMVFKEKAGATVTATGDVQPDLRDVEEEYWRLVQDRDCHVQVQQGSIDTGAGGGEGSYGFPTSRGSSCGRHPWNLKILSNNKKSLLRTMGPVMGVTVPTLHVGMLFTTSCWYRDSHGLPWVEYHHTGAPKVWFAIPDSHSIAFYTAMKQLAPQFCRKRKIWMAQDLCMIPPNLLVKHGVSVSRSIQEAGQFTIVFPKAYTSHVCTGYTVAESVYYAPRDYLDYAEMEFTNIRDSREPMMFPFPKLILSIAKDEKSSLKTLRKVKPFLEKIRDNEYVKRTMISDLGVRSVERIQLKSGKKQQEEDEYECETCSANLYVSFVCDVKEDQYYCLDDAVKYLQTRKATQKKHCKLYYTHSKEEITAVIKEVNRRLDGDNSDYSESEESDYSGIPIRRVSELAKEREEHAQQDKFKALKQQARPPMFGDDSSVRSSSPDSSFSRIRSPSPSRITKKRLSGPNVPPGTAINVSSFALVKQATKKAKSDGAITKAKKKPPPQEFSSEEEDSSDNSDDDSEEDDSEVEEEEPPAASRRKQALVQDSDSEVQISKKAIKKAEMIKKKESAAKAASKTSSTATVTPKATPGGSGKRGGSGSNKKESPPAKSAKKETSTASSSKKGGSSKKAAASSALSKSSSSKKAEPEPSTSSGRGAGRGGGGGSRRKVKARKASNTKTGNLASELLDMLLSTDEDDSGNDSSDEAWK